LPKELLDKNQSYAYNNSIENKSVKEVFEAAEAKRSRDRAEVLRAARQISRIPKDKLKYAKMPSLNLDKAGEQCLDLEQEQALRDSNLQSSFTSGGLKYSKKIERWFKNKPKLLQNHMKDTIYKFAGLDEGDLLEESVFAYVLDLSGVSESELSELMDRTKVKRFNSPLVDHLFKKEGFEDLPAHLRPSKEELNGRRMSARKCRELAILSKNNFSNEKSIIRPSKRTRVNQ